MTLTKKIFTTLVIFICCEMFFLNCSSKGYDSINIFQIPQLKGIVHPKDKTIFQLTQDNKLYQLDLKLGGFSLISSQFKKIVKENLDVDLNDEKYQQKKPENIILIANACFIYGGAEAYFTQGKAVINLMNQLKFDALVVGHREFSFGKDTLEELSKIANFPIVCCNLIDQTSKQRPYFFKPYIIKNIGGYKIGILGVGNRRITEHIPKRFLKGTILEYEDISKSITRYVKELKEKEKVNKILVFADFPFEIKEEMDFIAKSEGDFVFFTNVNLPKDIPKQLKISDFNSILGKVDENGKKLISSSYTLKGNDYILKSGIDNQIQKNIFNLLKSISYKSYIDISKPQVVTNASGNKIKVYCALNDGESIGHYKITNFKSNNPIEEYSIYDVKAIDKLKEISKEDKNYKDNLKKAEKVKEIDYSKFTEPDISLSKDLNQIYRLMFSLQREIIGQANEDIVHFNDRESPFGDLICDIFIDFINNNLSELKIDKKVSFFVINSGAYRDGFKKGDISKIEIFKVMPYIQNLHIVKMSGSTILELLNRSVSYQEERSFLQVSKGLKFKFIKNHTLEEAKLKTFKKPNEVIPESVYIDDRPLNISEDYYIAIETYLKEGGDRYDLFKDKNKVTLIRDIDYPPRDILKDYIINKSPISYKIDKRNRRIEEVSP